MFDYYYTFRSITFAQRAQQILANARIPCALLRAPKSMSAKGCGYALKLRPRDTAGAAALLRNAGVPISGVYRVRPDGSAEAAGV